jgi:hypothetical protein
LIEPGRMGRFNGNGGNTVSKTPAGSNPASSTKKQNKMVQRIIFLPNIAVLTTYEGESYRRYTAGIFYACTLTIFGAAPVWNCNGTTALVVVSNGSAAPSFYAAKQTNLSVMLTTEKTCLVGKNSTRQATSAHETGNLSSFTTDMQIVAAIIGPDLALQLMHNLGGVSIYIPKPPQYAIIYNYYLICGNVKLTAARLRVSERTVFRAIAANEKAAAVKPATAKSFDLNYKI